MRAASRLLTPTFRPLARPTFSLTRMASTKPTLAEAERFAKFVDASPSPFHAVVESTRVLEAAGFTRLSERAPWGALEKGGRYFVTRNQSALVAFVVGGAFEAGNGFTISAAHTDSPCLRVKPVSSADRSGYLTVGTEWYGGLLVYTWFDRDLSVAGRVLVERGEGASKKIESRLVIVDRPILRVPSLAIHLDRSANDGFAPNKESHLWAVLATTVKAVLNDGDDAAATAAAVAAETAEAAKDGGAAAAGGGGGGGGAGDAGDASFTSASTGSCGSCGSCAPSTEVSRAAAAKKAAAAGSFAPARHHPLLLDAVCEALGDGTEPAQVKDFELYLFDTQKAAIGGVRREFLFAPRLDNLLMSYACTRSLIESSVGADGGVLDSVRADPNVRVVGLFDNEEVGSDSVPGAGSTLMEDVLRRINDTTAAAAAATASASASASASVVSASESWAMSMRKSLLVSADMAHAVHPNYADKHESNHKPRMHGGIVLKHNSNQRYATSAVTASFVRRAAEAAGVPVQEFLIRQDIGCGSTIGPILATRLGIRAVDIGVPQLSMHSIREMCGTDDVHLAIKLLTELYSSFAAFDASLEGTD